METNLRAFLWLIRNGEGTSDPNGYLRLFGGRPGRYDKLFAGFADHPRVRTYEKRDEFIKNGKKDYTTAAGAYQITATTWDSLRKAGVALPDFSPANQDKAATALIARRKALDDVHAGRWEDAIRKCNTEWASLPGSPYGQPTLTLAKAKKILADFIAAQPEAIIPLKRGADGKLSLHVSTNTAPTIQPLEVQPMLPAFIAAALPTLLNAAPDLIRVFGKGEQSEKNAQAAAKVVEIAKVVTGETTAEGAVAKIQSDPAMADAFSAEARAQFLEIEAMAEKRIAAAREFNKSDEPMFGRVKFVHILSLLVAIAALAGIGYILITSTDPTERSMALQTLLIGGFSGVLAYWIGSSQGSDKKTDLMRGPSNG